jgi:transcriptional regulator with XRE-family HTH domain
MARKRKIDYREIARLAKFEGLGVVKIAERVGLTKGAVSKVLKKIEASPGYRSLAKEGEWLLEVASDEFDPLRELRDAHRALKRAFEMMRKDLEDDIVPVGVPWKIELLIKCGAEMRKHTEAITGVYRTACEFSLVKKYCDLILEGLNELEPEVREKVLGRVRKYKPARLLLGAGGSSV